MLQSLKKLTVALALTFSIAAGMTLSSGIAAPAPAEAGILSSVKNIAKTAVKTPWIGTKIVVKKVVFPVVKVVKKHMPKLPPIVCVRAPCKR